MLLLVQVLLLREPLLELRVLQVPQVLWRELFYPFEYHNKPVIDTKCD